MARRPSGSGRVARTRRLLLPGRSPLARTCDRLEGALVLVLVALGVSALPAAVPAHAVCAHQLELAEQAAAQGRRQVEAQVLDGPLLPAAEPGGSGPGVSADQSVRVSWTGLDGRSRTGLVPVDVTSRPGARVLVWADDAGTARPVTSARERAVASWGQVALLVATWWCCLVTARLVVGAAVDRWRARWWSRQWALTGPRWTSRA